MSRSRFAGRRALVTGASRGIGAAVAQRLAAEGADIALCARTLGSAAGDGAHLSGSLTDTVARIRRYKRRSVPLVADLSDEDDRARVVPTAVDQLGGPIDILVNNAAANISQPVADMALRRRRVLFELNVQAPLDLAQAVVPAMRTRGAGWIVNISSRTASSWDGPPFDLGPSGTGTAIYGASKAALNRVTNGLAAELYGTGIRVNTVEPRAAVLTEGARQLVGDTLGPEKVESVEEMTEAVVALCDCPDDVTGGHLVSLDLLASWGLTVHTLGGLPRTPPSDNQADTTR